MHRVVAVLIAVSALPCTQVASAADIPAKAPPPVRTPLPPYNWTGFYLGGNVGAAWSTTDWTSFNGATLEPTRPNGASWLAGGQIGYLYQFNPNLVIGIEASLSGTNLKETSTSIAVADRFRE